MYSVANNIAWREIAIVCWCAVKKLFTHFLVSACFLRCLIKGLIAGMHRDVTEHNVSTWTSWIFMCISEIKRWIKQLGLSAYLSVLMLVIVLVNNVHVFSRVWCIVCCCLLSGQHIRQFIVWNERSKHEHRQQQVKMFRWWTVDVTWCCYQQWQWNVLLTYSCSSITCSQGLRDPHSWFAIRHWKSPIVICWRSATSPKSAPVCPDAFLPELPADSRSRRLPSAYNHCHLAFHQGGQVSGVMVFHCYIAYIKKWPGLCYKITQILVNLFWWIFWRGWP